MKRKYRLMRAMIYERKALENYINSMAKDNWHVDKLGLIIFVLKIGKIQFIM